LIKSDRCVRMLVSRNCSRNELADINKLKECMAKAPLTFRNPRNSNPTSRNSILHGTAYLYDDVLALKEVADGQRT
jgi:hypothetical protein